MIREYPDFTCHVMYEVLLKHKQLHIEGAVIKQSLLFFL